MMFKKIEEIIFDEKTNTMEVISTRIIPILNIRNSSNFIYATGKITQSTFDYYLITYPSRDDLSNHLNQGDKIKVKYKDIITSVEISSVKGRLSSLSRIIQSKDFSNQFNIGDTIKIIYDPSSRLVELKK